MEGWAERVSELEAEMRRCEVTYSGMQQDVANKDERIMVWLVVALGTEYYNKLLYIVLEFSINLFQTRSL